MSAHSLLLGDDWDLHIGADGNIQRAVSTYSIAQNVANAFRLFTNDAYYNSERGIPHFAIELKKNPAISVLKARLKKAALAVEGVKDCSINVGMFENRTLTGFAQITTINGDIVNVNF